MHLQSDFLKSTCLPICLFTYLLHKGTSNEHEREWLEQCLHHQSGISLLVAVSQLQALSRQAELQNLHDLAVIERQLLQFKDSVRYQPQWDGNNTHRPVRTLG